jgi:hypothetical protein
VLINIPDLTLYESLSSQIKLLLSVTNVTCLRFLQTLCEVFLPRGLRAINPASLAEGCGLHAGVATVLSNRGLASPGLMAPTQHGSRTTIHTKALHSRLPLNTNSVTLA